MAEANEQVAQDTATESTEAEVFDAAVEELIQEEAPKEEKEESTEANSEESEEAEEKSEEKEETDEPSEAEGEKEGVQADAKPEEKKVEDPALEKSWKAVVKKDQELVVREKAIKTAERDIKAIQALKEDFESDPIGWITQRLSSEGIKALSERILNNGKPSLEEENQLLKRRMQLEEQKRNEQSTTVQVEAAQNAQTAYLENVAELVSTSEDFELIKSQGAINDVWDYAEFIFNQSQGQTILSPEDACKQVESYLESKIEEIAKSKKFQNKFQPAPKTESGKKNSKTKTLTNKDSSQTGKTKKHFNELSDTEKLDRIVDELFVSSNT